MRKKIVLGSLIVLFLDQITKFLVQKYWLNQVITIIPSFLTINFTNNTGGAFSLFQNHVVFLILVSFGALIFFWNMEKEVKNQRLRVLIFSLLYGGVLGNLIDRIFFHYVRDFLDFAFFGYHYPTFNIADVAIVIGIFLLIFSMFREKRSDYAKICS